SGRASHMRTTSRATAVPRASPFCDTRSLHMAVSWANGSCGVESGRSRSSRPRSAILDSQLLTEMPDMLASPYDRFGKPGGDFREEAQDHNGHHHAQHIGHGTLKNGLQADIGCYPVNHIKVQSDGRC